MNITKLSAYRVMWLFVFFDLPVKSKKQIKRYTKFRSQLMECGFTMHQYSVYIRHCASKESVDVYLQMVESIVPEEGHISVLQVTDKQFGNIKNFWGQKSTPVPEAPKQLEMF